MMIKAWLMVVTMLLLVTPVVFAETNVYAIEVEEIIFTKSYVDIVYTPMVSDSGLISCDLVINEESVLRNVFATGNRENEIKYDASFESGEYEVELVCNQGEIRFLSDVYVVELDVESKEEPSENKKDSETIDISSSDVFFIVVVGIALFLLFKKRGGKVDKNRNKRLRRFS